MNPLPRNTTELRTAVHNDDRASHKWASDGLVTSVARRFVPSWRHQIDMSIINKKFNGFFELSLFVCEIFNALDASYLFTDPC